MTEQEQKLFIMKERIEMESRKERFEKAKELVQCGIDASTALRLLRLVG